MLKKNPKNKAKRAIKKAVKKLKRTKAHQKAINTIEKEIGKENIKKIEVKTNFTITTINGQQIKKKGLKYEITYKKE